MHAVLLLSLLALTSGDLPATKLLTTKLAAGDGQQFAAVQDDTHQAQPAGTGAWSDQGAWERTIRAGYMAEVRGNSEAVATLSCEVGKYVWDDVFMHADLVAYGLFDSKDSVGIGIDVGVRYHVLHIGRATLFGEISVGILGSTERFPVRGTRLNTNYGAGVGISYPLTDGTRLLVGADFLHVSNGDTSGSDRNPSINTLGGFLGVSFQF